MCLIHSPNAGDPPRVEGADHHRTENAAAALRRGRVQILNSLIFMDLRWWCRRPVKQQQWPEILTAEFGTVSDERRVHARKLAGVGTPEPNSDRAAFGAITSAGSARELFDANT